MVEWEEVAQDSCGCVGFEPVQLSVSESRGDVEMRWQVYIHKKK
jgi:hypothetical protein